MCFSTSSQSFKWSFHSSYICRGFVATALTPLGALWSCVHHSTVIVRALTFVTQTIAMVSQRPSTWAALLDLQLPLTAPTGFFAFRVSRTVAGAGLWSGGLPVSGQQRPDLRGALRAPRAGSHTGRVTRFGFEVERWSRMWGFMGQNESTGKFTAGSSLCFPFSGCDLGYLVPIMGFWRLRNHFGASEMV